MFLPNFTTNILDQGCALVQAIKAVDTMETGNPLEREVARLFQGAWKRRLHEIADIVSAWDVEEILSTGADTAVH